MKIAKALVAAVCLAVSAAAWSQAMLQEKVYNTGDALKKPMVMTPFTEFQNARKIPALDLYTLSGEPVDLRNYRGNVVILNIWASWCAPCIREIPAITKLQQELKNSKIKIIGVSVDDSVTGLPRFLKRNKVSDFMTLVDPRKTVDNVIPLTVVPTNYILDGDGNMVGVLRGYLPWEDPDVLTFLKKLEAKYPDPAKLEESGKQQ